MRRIEMLAKHLIESVENNDIESVRTLTEELKDDVNKVIPYRNKPERDALTHAAHHGNITIATHIVNNYGNVNIFYNNERWNAVTEAIAHRNGDMVDLFLSKATPTTKQKALDYAREEEKPDDKMIGMIAQSMADDVACIFGVIKDICVVGEQAADSSEG